MSRYGVAIIGFMVESSRMDPNRRLPVSDAYELRTTVRRVRNALSALGVITVVGVLGYMFLEGWGFIDALYMTVITLTTVGYREVRDLDTTGQLWTMALLITGVGTLFYAAVTSVELAVEGAVRGYFERRRMTAEINKLNGHYVLCGFGRVGHQVAREFALEGVPFVVIDNDPEKVEECLAEDRLAILGEASDDDILEDAGIRRAKGLVAAVNSDAANVFVVLSARKINPSLHIVARASSDESAAKLEIAGADRTLSPYAVGGRRLPRYSTPHCRFPGRCHTWREGHRVQARGVRRAQGVAPGEPHHRRASDRGEDRSHGPGHPNLGGQVRHHSLRPGRYTHRRHPDRARRPRPS